VAMGETCRCGYWNGEEVGGVNRPVGMSGLMWHRAQEMADALAAAGLLAGEAVDVDEIKRRAVEKITIMNKVAEQMGM